MKRKEEEEQGEEWDIEVEKEEEKPANEKKERKMWFFKNFEKMLQQNV